MVPHRDELQPARAVGDAAREGGAAAYPRRAALRLAGAGMLVGALAACSSKKDENSIGEQAKDGSRKGYIEGSGTVETVPPDKREAPLTISGPTIDGKTWSLKGNESAVVVVNVWGSWCPPCVKETPELKKAYAALKDKKVSFIGVNVKESPESGQAFATAQKMEWPSLAYDGGKPLLQLRGKAQSFPTTLVLDEQGRIAARVSGEVNSTTLIGLVNDVLTGKN